MLNLHGITKRYGKKIALEDISLTLAPGDAIGLVGHNGSGKSTLLSIMAQVIRPDDGTILVNGKPVLGDREFVRSQLGYVPQNDWLLSDLSVRETLAFWQSLHGLPGSVFDDGSIARALGLDRLAGMKVGQLSGGMQKRLSLALALLHGPRYLLMDEALSALDRVHRQVTLERLALFLRQGGAVIYSSHLLEDVRELCDRLIVLRDGRMVFNGKTDTFPSDAGTLDILLNPLEGPVHG